MSLSSRVVFKRLEIEEELLVTPASVAAADEPPPGFARPHPADLAKVLATVDFEWFEEFLRHLLQHDRSRAFEVAAAVQGWTQDPDGGDCSPVFGVDDHDSAKLLELYQAIDAIGWNNQADEERGNYLGRLKQIREELSGVATAALQQQVARLATKVQHQRRELRRFNRDARIIAERNTARETK